MDDASSSILASSNLRRGWKGLGVILSTSTLRLLASLFVSAFDSAASGISALRPLPNPLFCIDTVLSTTNYLLCQIAIVLRPRGACIIQAYRLAITRALAE